MVVKPTTQLEGSSCQHPNGGDFYRQQREKVIQQATSMGFEYHTMSEYPLSWADDQDPFQHVGVGAYMHMVARCGHRLFESFEGPLKEKYESLIRAQGVGIVTKSFNVNLKSALTYPDSIIIASRITDVRKDRIIAKFSLWSLQRAIITAEADVRLVFVDHQRGHPVDLISRGGVFADLHADLTNRASQSDRLALEWVGNQKREARM
ncbi:uncharacterized protein N7446_000984 [Penicillium canescens]|uniref:Uncharacterized protein n=1 Tax=Penicillium canescens TaxID=5083 RepID=A0AAD6N459_PENCN|nr:uncharacterized protein N7446_000984 [Penicillium canescens]KAJ6029953.1 hypothetical protein N7460_010219 [Penicillium canescens]KAJ6060331.1 hypothetical protein N7444_002185 [Penicillium canescens]KAJ6078048.1 hypothetical protein N7446_000984 [Penicillium canescens]